jgi:hypothetical protein
VRGPQGVASYTVFNWVLALLVVLGTMAFIVGRYCCICCPKKCKLLRYGHREPTKRTWACGFTDLPDGSIGYPLAERAGVRCLLLCFVLFLMCVRVCIRVLRCDLTTCVVCCRRCRSMFILSQTNGNQQLTANSATIASSTGTAAMAIVTGLVPVTEQLLINISSQAVAPMLVNLSTVSKVSVVMPVGSGTITMCRPSPLRWI